MRTITNLVFKGGGILGIAYAGALQDLAQRKALNAVQKVAGTSAGAITAALVSLRYTPAEIKKIVNSTDFKTFEDGNILVDLANLPTHYGYFKGDTFLLWMQNCILQKGLSPNATFADFKKAGCLELQVYATDLTLMQTKKFSFDETPDTEVAHAVRASMSIPLFFEAWQFPNSKPDNHLYVDGGVLDNFPLNAFDTGGSSNPETLGLFLLDMQNTKPHPNFGYGHFLQYIHKLSGLILDVQSLEFENNSGAESRCILIDNLGISSTNFHISQPEKDALFESGRKHSADFFTT